MNRYHYSCKIIEYLDNMNYKQNIGFKPTGLWYSIEGDWEIWCRNNNFRTNDLKYKYLIDFDILKIINIFNEKNLIDFHNEFKIKTSIYFDNVNWLEVSQKYSGFEISNFPNKIRNNFNWLYGWDCSSGCIWDINIIKSFELC